MSKFKVGDRVRRRSNKVTRPNPHPVMTIAKFHHSNGIDWVSFKEFGTMSVVGLKYYEKVEI